MTSAVPGRAHSRTVTRTIHCQAKPIINQSSHSPNDGYGNIAVNDGTETWRTCCWPAAFAAMHVVSMNSLFGLFALSSSLTVP
jgi:hypothetical protein